MEGREGGSQEVWMGGKNHVSGEGRVCVKAPMQEIHAEGGKDRHLQQGVQSRWGAL